MQGTKKSLKHLSIAKIKFKIKLLGSHNISQEVQHRESQGVQEGEFDRLTSSSYCVCN